MKKTLYDILGIDSAAPQNSIENAYRIAVSKLEKQLNDEDPESHNKAVLIKEAYRILSNPEKRAEYDARISRQNAAGAETVIPEVAYPQSQQDSDEESASGWSSSKISLAVIVFILGIAVWVGFGYYKNSARAAAKAATPPAEATVDLEAQQARAQQDLARQQAEIQKKEQELRQKELELKQEKENARQTLLQRRDEEHAGLQQQQQKQREEDERQRLAEARREREQEAKTQADRKRQYQACLNQAIDRYGLDRARQMCTNLR